jgi:hypothetical protein
MQNNILLANIIKILHIMLVLFILLGPFVNDVHVILLYMMIVPFIQLHWVTNNDTCALTIAECKLRNIKPENSFFHGLVSPVYKFNEKYESIMIWILTFVLWLIAVYRFFYIISPRGKN